MNREWSSFEDWWDKSSSKFWVCYPQVQSIAKAAWSAGVVAGWRGDMTLEELEEVIRSVKKLKMSQEDWKLFKQKFDTSEDEDE